MSKPSKGHVGNLGLLNPAIVVLACAGALTILGLTVLLSASIPVSADEPYQFIERQALWVALTLLVGFAVSLVDLEWIRRFIWLGYALGIIALIAVLIPGVGSLVNGSRSWIRFGGIGVQVSEFAKIALVFFVAHYFSSIRQENRSFWRGYIIPCSGIGLYVGLIILQPDLGTALVYSVAAVCLLYLAGVKLLYLVPSVSVGFAAVVALVYHDAERWSRLTAFWNMEAEKAGDAYQGWQALLAFGAGGIQGVGLGNGRQQLSFLPEAHNDFIFAIVGEELGLVATLAVVAIYGVLFATGVLHTRRAPNTYHYLLASGCVLMITVQALLNLGVVTGVLPTTGLPLPFISYGGSNYMTMGICVAVIVNAGRAWQAPALQQSKRKLKEIEA